VDKKGKWLPVHQEILDECRQIQPLYPWGRKMKDIIQMATVHGDRYKRVTLISTGKTYLVPISHIMCYGIRAEEVPLKYKEAV
jgi:hypothetical protein